MIRTIRKRAREFAAIIGLIAIAVGISGYILQKQRLRIPIIEPKPFQLKAEFQTAQAVTAGQGQTVRVSGIRIGDIGKVELENGKAVITMDLDRKFKDLIHKDATALLRPKTGLKDMFVEVDPGGDEGAPLLKKGERIPLAQTRPDVNPDEILSVLDADTRDYLKLLLNGAGEGLEDRGGDLRALYKRFEPTNRHLAELNGAITTRRSNLRRLVASLDELNEELESNGKDVTEFVGFSSQVLRSFASVDDSISESVDRLPGTLQETTRTLNKVESFARVLGPSAETLRPAVRELDAANQALRPLARQGTPLLRDSIRPFVREARPLVRELRPAARRLDRSAKPTEGALDGLNRFFNILTHNPGGTQAPGQPNRQEGYLYWLAWLQHMGLQLHSTADANGIFRPLTLAAPCATFEQIIAGRPELEFLLGLTPIVSNSGVCK